MNEATKIGTGGDAALKPSKKGWTCPKCGGVWSPSVSECSRCNPQGRDTNRAERQSVSERFDPPSIDKAH